MGSIGIREVLVVVLIIVILFGARRIPELARSLGRGISEFKGGMRDSSTEEKKQEPPPPKT